MDAVLSYGKSIPKSKVIPLESTTGRLCPVIIDINNTIYKNVYLPLLDDSIHNINELSAILNLISA